MPSRTRSTVWPSVITPVRVRGAAPKTAAAVSPGNASSSPLRNQSTKPWMPACRIWPDPRPALGGQLGEPRHVGEHPRHRGGAEGAGRAAERVRGTLARPAVVRRLGYGAHAHASTVVRDRRPASPPGHHAARAVSHSVHRSLVRRTGRPVETADVTSEHTLPSDLSRRSLLAAAGLGAAAVAAARTVGPATAARAAGREPRGGGGAGADVPPVAGLHLQFGADAATQVTVSWHATQQRLPPARPPRPQRPRVRATVDADTRSYTDAKSGQVVYAHHARVARLRPDTEYVYLAVHDGAQPQFGTFRTAPTGRAAFTFTSFGDQGTPTSASGYVPPAGVTLPNPPYVNDNLGSPAAGDTTAGVERVAAAVPPVQRRPLLRQPRRRPGAHLVGLLEQQHAQRPQPAVDAGRRQPRERARQRPDRLRAPTRPTSRCRRPPGRPT